MSGIPASAWNPAEIWAWNGTPLNAPYWNVSTWGGSRFGLPTLRGQDVEVPYKAGQRWRSKYPNERAMTLNMWTAGIDPATAQPAADTRLAFNNNWLRLRQMFWARGASGSQQGRLQRQWYITQAGSSGIVTATALAEIAGSMEPTMQGRTSAAFTVDLMLADPYFYGAPVSQVIGTAGGTITNYGEGVAGEGFPSPVSSFTVAVTQGPVTITNITAGVSLIYNAPVTAAPVTIDVLRQTATDPGGHNLTANIQHAGARTWMALLGQGSLDASGSPVAGTNVITVSAGTATFTFTPPYV